MSRTCCPVDNCNSTWETATHGSRIVGSEFTCQSCNRIGAITGQPHTLQFIDICWVSTIHNQCLHEVCFSCWSQRYNRYRIIRKESTDITRFNLPTLG
jgi:hypothetical protein